ncbi:hypothetical protein [Cohnella nanjingensis]|uniref:Uncharacterized protein n=1 Tax=Cohnella nanjingensis TaxID=1387779 RepID=A0A7X0S0G7_9BACL|nr:hypothetical protein [Cohnella nanjingensis]MBB6675675.1 hypothetical protein [Cohnella nanjingensis]
MTERIVSRAVPAVARPGVILLGGAARRTVRLAYDGEALDPQIERRVFRNHFGEEETYYTIDLHARDPRVLSLRIALTFQFQ